MSDIDTPNRYTFAPLAGYKTTAFGVGLGLLILREEARSGRPVLQVDLSRRSGLSVPTWRKLLYESGVFEVSTLRAAADALGEERWENIVKRGQETDL